MNVLKERYHCKCFQRCFLNSLFRNVILVKFWIWVHRIFILWFIKYQLYTFGVLNNFYAVLCNINEKDNVLENMVLQNHWIYIELCQNHNICMRGNIIKVTQCHQNETNLVYTIISYCSCIFFRYIKWPKPISIMPQAN